MTTTNIKEKILAVFQAEHKEQVEGIRTLLPQLQQAPQGLDRGRLDEAFRLAHSLKGGARVCDLPVAETFGHKLETLFAEIREGRLTLDERVMKIIDQALDAVEDWMASIEHQDEPPDTTPALEAIESLLGADASQSRTSARPALKAQAVVPEATEPAVAAETATSAKVPPRETVRIAAESLDRLLRTSSRLLTEGLHLEQVGHDLEGIRTQINGMNRERELLRRMATTSLHRLCHLPEFDQLSRYFESVDRQIQRLSRSMTLLCRSHRRSAWQIRSRSRQIQRQVRDARMVPAAGVFQGFRKMVRDLARDEKKPVDFDLQGLDVRADRLVLQALKDPLMHVLRNCISHGIEPADERRALQKPAEGKVSLKIEAASNRLEIVVEDDGRGIDARHVAAAAIRRGIVTEAEAAALSSSEVLNLLFAAGFSTTETVTPLSGRGMGLSVVQEAVARLQGEARIDSQHGQGTRVTLSVPVTVATHRLLLVTCGAQTFAIPARCVMQLVRLDADRQETIEGRSMIRFHGRHVPLERLSALLGVPGGAAEGNGRKASVAVVNASGQWCAIRVDSFRAEADALVHCLTGPAARYGFDGAIVLEDGEAALVLNPAQLLRPRKPIEAAPIAENAPPTEAARVPRILVVDDSFTTRALEKSILEAHGYEVEIAIDGVDALSRLAGDAFDLVISDIEMPHMNGFELLENLKQHDRFSSIPVVLVTSRDQIEDRSRGLELGADAYIVKRNFDHEELLMTIRQIVGDRGAAANGRHHEKRSNR